MKESIIKSDSVQQANSHTAIERPTKKQKELLVFVENFISGHGYGPSYREIRAGMGYNSVATVAKHINNLISRGHLRKRDHSARSLEVVRAEASIEDTLVIRGSIPTKAQEQWLVAKIQEQFRRVEESELHDQGDLNELAVLVQALKILGFDGAAQTFSPQIAALKKRSASLDA